MYSQSAINILTDIVFLILPIPAVLKANLPIRVKISVILIFCLGAMYILTPI
jgi:hypothetical protein